MANADFIENSNLYMQAKQELKKGNLIRGLGDLYKVLFESKYYRPNIVTSMKIALLTKMCK